MGGEVMLRLTEEMFNGFSNDFPLNVIRTKSGTFELAIRSEIRAGIPLSNYVITHFSEGVAVAGETYEKISTAVAVLNRIMEEEENNG
jgi:hypothetical protein